MCSGAPDLAAPGLGGRTRESPLALRPRLPLAVSWGVVTDTPLDSTTGLPVRLLHDRLLVREDADSERRSAAGIVIPATAAMGRRLHWAEAVGVGPLVRSVVAGDRVMFDPEDKAEVEMQGRTFILLRERDIHAVAAKRVDDDGTGLYL